MSIAIWILLSRISIINDFINSLSDFEMILSGALTYGIVKILIFIFQVRLKMTYRKKLIKSFVEQNKKMMKSTTAINLIETLDLWITQARATSSVISRTKAEMGMNPDPVKDLSDCLNDTLSNECDFSNKKEHKFMKDFIEFYIENVSKNVALQRQGYTFVLESCEFLDRC